MIEHLDGNLSRRRFLQLGTAAAVGLAGLPALAGADKKDEKDPFAGFKVGVQSYSFRNFKLEQALKRTKELGLHYIEFFQAHVPIDSTEKQIKAVLKLCKDYDVTPVAYGVQHFSKDHEKNKKYFEFGKALGIAAFSASPDPDSFDSLDKLTDEYKINIAIHPHGPVGRNRLDKWYSAEVILKAVKDHGKRIGTCLDTGHLIRCAMPPFNKKLDPAKQIKLMGERNYGIHLKDNDNKKDENVPFGKGVLDVPGVLKALKDVKFKGWISIEYEANPDNPVPDMKECVKVIKESVKKVNA
jgi:sugar phosphate isomerase/epimerase